MSSPSDVIPTAYPSVCPAPPHPPSHVASTTRFDLGPPQRRRVNPESLAARLGPELVAEMEKHIIPGSIEMPPFSVRRDIQVKFGIDRRHIYDFFHSRGLRCLNEKSMRNGLYDVKSPRPARIIAPPSEPIFSEPRKRRAAVAASEATFMKSARAPRKQKFQKKRQESTRSPSPSDLPLALFRDSSSSTPCLPELDMDSMATDFSQEDSPASEPFFLDPDVVFCSAGQETTPHLSPCLSVSSLCDLSSSMPTPSLSASSSFSSNLSSSFSLDEPEPKPKVLPLSLQERQAHYAWMDNIIGAASGIQESMGSYKTFMEQQRDLYYDRLRYKAEQPTKAPDPYITTEFTSWLGSMQHSDAATNRIASPTFARSHVEPAGPNTSSVAPTSGFLSSSAQARPPVHEASRRSVVMRGEKYGRSITDIAYPQVPWYLGTRGIGLPMAPAVLDSAHASKQNVIGDHRLVYSIPDRTQHPRRRTVSAAGDM
ncbi:hypothetical protein BC834DRAFT_850298 [Gloeopeniophorella convolvens]|nr:hypothetical protein BC834DRAFT_850298 [Gloeopeniophorella convolvens]